MTSATNAKVHQPMPEVEPTTLALVRPFQIGRIGSAGFQVCDHRKPSWCRAKSPKRHQHFQQRNSDG
jgi:hypothetical protein